MRSLAQVAAQLNDEEVPEAPPVAGLSSGSLLSWRGQSRLDELDLVDVDGMAEAKYAVEVAAAGGHHVMLTGPKGAGKTTLAERLPEHPARPDRRGVARADGPPLAGRGARSRATT